MKRTILSMILLVTASTARGAVVAAPGWAVHLIPTPATVQGGVVRRGGALLVGQGEFGTASESIIRLDAGGATTIATGFNSLGGFDLDAAGTLYVVDNCLECTGAATGDTVFGIPDALTRLRKDLMSGAASLPALLAREGWSADVRGLRYLSHFITPTSSPIRFTARFFLCRVPDDQAPALFTEETSEAFWIHPGEGYRRFLAGEMAMAEPAEYGLGYLAQFRSVGELWAAHADGQQKFHGVSDRLDAAWADFDWKANRFSSR